jgi:monofunctional biosynthetic peptidoglycan transglycosylase
MARRVRRSRPTRWLLVLGWLAVIPFALAELYAVVPVPFTPLMLIRLAQGYGLHKIWVPLHAMSAAAPYAVIAAEDNRFCGHHGFDWQAIGDAYAEWQAAQMLDVDQSMRGASTLSQQTAKNVFLWPRPAILRKVFEAPLTVLIETLWGKRRILEVYLNVAEWGPGIYGIEAASRYYFHTHARSLSYRQAALLAAVLPNPLDWHPAPAGPYVSQRAAIIQGRIWKLGPMLNCVAGGRYIPSPPRPKQGMNTPCPNCPKSKPPAAASSPSFSASPSSPSPSATPASASPFPPALPPPSSAAPSPGSSAAPNTFSPISTTTTP